MSGHNNATTILKYSKTSVDNQEPGMIGSRITKMTVVITDIKGAWDVNMP